MPCCFLKQSQAFSGCDEVAITEYEQLYKSSKKCGV